MCKCTKKVSLRENLFKLKKKVQEHVQYIPLFLYLVLHGKNKSDI